jgi:type II secretory pathway pseudopilin PulG
MMHRIASRARGRGRSHAGLTLVETATVVSVIGMVLAVALPTLQRTIRVSKVAEAPEQLESLYRASTAYYAEARARPADDPTSARHATAQRHCLPAAAGPTPETPSPTPRAVDFGADDVAGKDSWRALGFTPSMPLRYRYSFAPSSSGCDLPAGATLILRAEGDLDGDGVYSRFERRAQINADGTFTPEPVLHIEDRIE